ncbi:MAG: hypothetical protein J6Q03_09020 [Paludibacteraceae bacterium]|nr:hypothetical protein [Paludibacteraceae bacterium]
MSKTNMLSLIMLFCCLNAFSENRITEEIDSLITHMSQCSDSLCKGKDNNTMDSLLIVGESNIVDVSKEIYLNIENIRLSLESNKLLLQNLRKTYDYWLIAYFFNLNDVTFRDDLLAIYEENKVKYRKHKIVNIRMENTLIRLGFEDFLLKRLSLLEKATSDSDILNEDFSLLLEQTQYVANRDFCDLLISFILTENSKRIIIGSYGGDPYEDDNIYCNLSKYSATILKDLVKDFPTITNDCELINDKELKEIKKWCELHKNNFQMNVVLPDF